MSESNPNKILEYLGIVFSTIFISGINIALSGHLLGYILNLDVKGDNVFALRIPWLFGLKIRGNQVIAGFISFSISLFIVGICLSQYAKDIFITNLEATGNTWTACQSLATSISLSACLIVGSIKYFIIGFQVYSNTPKDDSNDRVKKLIQK